MKKKKRHPAICAGKSNKREQPKGLHRPARLRCVDCGRQPVRWESDYLFYDEDGNMVDDCGHIIYENWQENDQYGTFWVGETKYTFTDLETIALDRDELYDAFLKAYRRGEMHAENALKSLRKDAETSKMAKLALKNAFELEDKL